MLSKADDVRINETMEFIRGLKGVPRSRLVAVVEYFNRHLPKLGTDARARLSGEMSVSGHASGVTLRRTTSSILSRASRMSGFHGDDERVKRRAVVLLWDTLTSAHDGMRDRSAPTVDDVMNMPAQSLDASLSDAILRVALCSRPEAVSDFFESVVVANMPEFVKRYKVTVAGSSAGTDRFTNPASNHFTNVQEVYFYYDYSRQCFAFAPNPPMANVPSHRVNVVSVPVVPWYDVPGNGGSTTPVASANANFSGILGCELSGARVMVTAQFTGCSFCWTHSNGQLRAAHIAPTRPGHTRADAATSFAGGGRQLSEDLVAYRGVGGHARAAPATGMGNAPGAPLLVFGCDDGNAPRFAGRPPFYRRDFVRQATVIGRKWGKTWELYAQTTDLRNAIEGRRIC